MWRVVCPTNEYPGGFAQLNIPVTEWDDFQRFVEWFPDEWTENDDVTREAEDNKSDAPAKDTQTRA
jgi:hypothetical protein